MNTLTQSKTILLGALALGLTFSSCKKDDDLVPVPPPVENEGEVITTLKITFTDAASVQPVVTATFKDPDGEGGDAPTMHDTIRLVANTTYNAVIEVLNESETPAEDITEEIEEEDHEHLFCFTATTANVTLTRTDSDGTYEVGLTSDWATGAASAGTVQVELKHQPDVKDGTCTPGETDIDVTFVTEIQ